MFPQRARPPEVGEAEACGGFAEVRAAVGRLRGLEERGGAGPPLPLVSPEPGLPSRGVGPRW